MVSWNIFRKSTITDFTETTETVTPIFDKKYSIIIKCKYSVDHFELISWVNLNTRGAADVKIVPEAVYIGFENSDDALFFKVKYSI